VSGTFGRPLASCAADGSRVAYDGASSEAVDAGPVTMSGVSVRIPGPPELADERVIRPALFVLFRIALGPSADYYGPRFLAFERAGRAMASWHWPALFAGPIWAFYRRLWGAGVFLTLLPLAGAATTALVAPWLGDHTGVWVACAILLTVLLPGIAGATLATGLLYRRIRKAIREAEAVAASPAQVASRIASNMPVSPHAALALGSFAVAFVVGGAGPVLTTAYHEHAVRVKVSKALAAVEPIKVQVENSWEAMRRWPWPALAAGMPGRASAVLFDEVSVDAASGRVRLDVGASIPELAGKAILLAPAIDQRERIRWFCVPVGVSERFLPQACRASATRQ
jgi:Pilin (bacterial filament)/Protein of unknown function (DUF2628)